MSRLAIWMALSLAVVGLGPARVEARSTTSQSTQATAIPNPAGLPTRIAEPPAGAGKAYLGDPGLSASYVEQEFLVSGRANIYDHDAQRRLVVKQAHQPYTTRILIRRPRDSARYSGVLIFDLLHPEAGSSTLWPSLSRYITRNGDAYVQVTTRREPRNPILSGSPGVIDRLKQTDPVRYAQIDFRDGGLTWDIVSQVGRLLKTNSAENPMRAFRPRLTIGGGFSGSGALTLFYINEGFADNARMPGGAPIFDAYFVGEPSWYPRVNSTVSPALDMAETDPRQPVKPRDVPTISLYSMLYTSPFGLGRVRPDSDAPNDRYRLYVVAGASHMGRTRASGEYSAQAAECRHPGGTLPLGHYFALTFDYLKRWADGKSVPPHAPPLKLDGASAPVLDANGNPQGGIRSPAIDVPAARYFPGEGGFLCELMGAEERFPAARMRQIYGSEARYVARVTARARQLQKEGWLLPESADEVIEEAGAVRFDK